MATGYMTDPASRSPYFFSSPAKTSKKMSSSAVGNQGQGSRRKASLKYPEDRVMSPATRDAAVTQPRALRDDILAGKANFQEVTSRYSDCSSAKRSGDLVDFRGRHGRKRKSSNLEEQDIFEYELSRRLRGRRERFVSKNIITAADGNDLKNKRRWEEMDHGILVNIMKRVSWPEWDRVVLTMCKSWFLAALDVFFPSPNLLDMRPHAASFVQRDHRRIVMLYTKLVLDSRSTTSYTQLLYPETPVPSPLHCYIAPRLPLLQRFELPVGARSGLYSVVFMVEHWRNLEELHFPVVLVEHLYDCKKIHTLHLFGTITNEKASFIAQSFPLLKHLEIPYCVLSNDALSTMLDGHKNLITLNTQHCCCLDDKDLQPLWVSYVYKHCDRRTLMGPNVKVKEWKEEKILRKTAGIKRHLQCARKNCSRCSNLY